MNKTGFGINSDFVLTFYVALFSCIFHCCRFFLLARRQPDQLTTPHLQRIHTNLTLLLYTPLTCNFWLFHITHGCILHLLFIHSIHDHIILELGVFGNFYNILYVIFAVMYHYILQFAQVLTCFTWNAWSINIILLWTINAEMFTVAWLI